MQIDLTGESVFRAARETFAVSPSESGYQVAFSSDGVNFTLDGDAVVPANEGLAYIGAVVGALYKLSGNTSVVKVTIG